MKTLLILFALALSSFALHAQIGPDPGHETFCPEAATPEIVDIVFTWDSDCETLNWSIVVCNNDDTCPTATFELDILVEWCASKFESINRQVGIIVPGGCRNITGSIETCIGHAGISVVLVETGQEVDATDDC